MRTCEFSRCENPVEIICVIGGERVAMCRKHHDMINSLLRSIARKGGEASLSQLRVVRRGRRGAVLRVEPALGVKTWPRTPCTSRRRGR